MITQYPNLLAYYYQTGKNYIAKSSTKKLFWNPFSLHDMGAWVLVVARYDVIMVEWLAIEGDTRADVSSDVLYCYEPCSWSLQSHRIWGTGELDKCYTFFLFQRETYLKYLISHSTRMWYSYSWHFASYLHPAVLIKL